MAKRVRIITDATGPVEAEITEDKNPKTARAVWEKLPIEARVATWGDEIYFPIPVKMGEENPQETVELVIWGTGPPRNSFCMFFGRTPVSRGGEIRPASPVNIFGEFWETPESSRGLGAATR